MKFLGIIEGKGLYASWNREHKQVRYSLDEQEVAVYDTKTMQLDSPIVFRNNTVANELSSDIKDQIQALSSNVNVDELRNDEEYGNNERASIARAIGLKKEQLNSITEIDIDDEKNKDKRNEKEIDNSEEDEKEKLATIKDIDIKQELKMDVMASSTQTIGNILKRAGKIPNVEGKSFTKLGIIETDRVKAIDKNAKTNTTRFSFVAIANDGTVVPINLEQDHQEGNNPREIGYRTNADGSVVQDDVKSRYRIGNSGETISIKTPNGPGDLEVGYSAHKTLGGETIDGNESVDHQLESSTVYWRPRKESRDQEYADGTRGAEERVREAHIESKHEDTLKENKKGKAGDYDLYKNIDGKEDTKEMHHEFDLRERARKLMSENEEVKEVFTEKEVIELLEKSHDQGNEIEKAEEDIKEDASMFRNHKR